MMMAATLWTLPLFLQCKANLEKSYWPNCYQNFRDILVSFEEAQKGQSYVIRDQRRVCPHTAPYLFPSSSRGVTLHTHYDN